MKDEIFEYLKEFGFTVESLNMFEEENEQIYFVNLKKVKENIDFFTNKGLNNKEIIKLALKNPSIITLSSMRKEAFENIYINKLNLTNEEIKYLLYYNDNVYTCSPIEFDKIINYLNNDKNYSITNIKKLILSNPSIINKKLDEIMKII